MSLCTEDEARTKLCPFAFSSSGARRCVASECMAWHFIDRDDETWSLSSCASARH
jgi:hypothetical protein